MGAEVCGTRFGDLGTGVSMFRASRRPSVIYPTPLSPPALCCAVRCTHLRCDERGLCGVDTGRQVVAGRGGSRPRVALPPAGAVGGSRGVWAVTVLHVGRAQRVGAGLGVGFFLGRQITIMCERVGHTRAGSNDSYTQNPNIP